MKLLSNFAISQPHAATAFTYGRSYISRTVPNISNRLQSLEDTIRSEFLPSIMGHPPPNDSMRKLLTLPARLGGLGIPDASSRSDDKFNASIKVTTPLINLKGSELTYKAFADQITAKREIQRDRREHMTQAASTLQEEVTPELSKAMDLASQPGASSWLSRPPTHCACGAAFVVDHMLSCMPTRWVSFPASQ